MRMARVLQTQWFGWVLIATLGAQPTPNTHPPSGGYPMLVVLATVEERATLQSDIAHLESQSWDKATLEQRLNEWATQRKLLLQKDPDQRFYMAVSQKLIQQSRESKRLALLRLLCSTIEQSQAIAFHQLPKDLQAVVNELTTRGEIYPGAFFRMTERPDLNKYLMLGALLYAEVPLENGKRVRVIVKNLFPYPEKWGSITPNLPPQTNRESPSPQKEAIDAMVILRTQLMDLRPELFQEAVQNLIRLWADEQERVRQQYEKELSDLRQKLAETASEQIGLQLGTDLPWSSLPAKLAQKIENKMRQNNLSAPNLYGSSIKLGIALRLQVAYVSAEKSTVNLLPFGGDYGPMISYEFPLPSGQPDLLGGIP
ncbi:hypothetical protein HRbin15_02525 [bacterium HR15]|nr:hypothetical protein HRbin15_02525 [bacterium HR15]